MNPKILIAEISGKRPGDKLKRPTEKFNFDFDKVIISNNSDGYVTDWPIIDVPEDYQKMYQERYKMSDLAYYAPMNRSYAIKYAREHGYDYLIQLDDNILSFDIKYIITMNDGSSINYSTVAATPNKEQLPNDMFKYMAEILKNSNAGMVGMAPDSASVPSDDWLKERYVYSAFILDLNSIADYFQGDFEDDIEYRLKLKQIGVPVLEVAPFHYSKTAQGDGKSEDTTGNREAYIKAGLKRGDHMAKLYGDYYERGYSDRGSGLKRKEKIKFRHKVKPFKVGVRINNLDDLKQGLLELFAKYVTKKPNSFKVSKDVPKITYRIQLNTDDYYKNIYQLIKLGITYNFTISRYEYDKSGNSIFSIKIDYDNKYIVDILKELTKIVVDKSKEILKV